jgi:transposase-like protein
MTIVPFPGAAHSKASSQKKAKRTRTSHPEENLLMSEFSYTCPHCAHKHYFRSEGIVFKVLEFFCSKCGVKQSVKNPSLK